jgi:hypothetical protein
MPSKTIGAVRSLGGDEFWYKLGTGGTWTSLGYVKEGYIFGDVSTIEKIPLAGGVRAALDTQRDVYIELEMAQTDKDALDLKATLHGKQGPFYMFDGSFATKHLELYAKNGTYFVSIEKKDSDKPQSIKITYEIEKQSSLCSCADTDLPSIKKCAPGTYTGVDNYLVWIATTIT